MTSHTKIISRPPVVVIVGHVDHGKTSILDYIRKSKVAEGESGGITQHIGAYQVEQSGKLITFIDTPGHEAFSAMRSRGVHVADIAVLVVAADDGIMPQTKEAIEKIQKAGIPLIVAVNKIDKPNADVQKARNQLLEHSVLLEGYGGSVPNVLVSAKNGEGINDLLEMINLVAELEELSSDIEKPLELVVIESALDAQRGPVATLLVKNGILKKGMVISGSATWAKVRHMEDFKGSTVEQATPSTPVVLLGFNSVPHVGERFVEVDDSKKATERITIKQRKEKEATIIAPLEGQKVINVVLKADVDGTLEAVREILRSMDSEEVRLRILAEGTGAITDSDIRLAESGNALVVGFRVKPNSQVRSQAEQLEVYVVTFDTIYELVEGVRAALGAFLQPETLEEIIGKITVLKIFRTEPSRMIVGVKVTDGEARQGAQVRVFREGNEIVRGKIKQLRHVEKVIEKAKAGEEVGILFEGSGKVEQGDILEVFERKSYKPSLGKNAQ